MTIILLLIPIALALGLLGLGAFIWSVRTGQYRDIEGDAYRIFGDEEDKPLSREDAKKARELSELDDD